MVSETDVMEFDLKESQVVSRLETLKQELAITKVRFNGLLGLDTGIALHPDGRLHREQTPGDIETYLKNAKTKSPGIKLAEGVTFAMLPRIRPS